MDIFQAAREGDVEWVRALVEQDAGLVNAPNEDEEIPLVLAANAGHLEVVRYLLDAGANIDHRGPYSWTVLHEAAWEGHAAIVSFLVQRGADVTAVTDDTLTALIIAAFYGHDAVVRLLLQHGGSDLNVVSEYGRTALHHACVRGHAGCVRQLLEAGDDATLRDADRSTPVDLAARNGHHNCVRVLEEWHGAYTLHRARSVCEASLIVANSSTPVDVAPMYLRDRATSGLAMPTLHVSPHQHHEQQSEDVGGKGHLEVDPVGVGGVVTVYAFEKLNGEVFVELLKLMGITEIGAHEV